MTKVETRPPFQPQNGYSQIETIISDMRQNASFVYRHDISKMNHSKNLTVISGTCRRYTSLGQSGNHDRQGGRYPGALIGKIEYRSTERSQ